MHQSPSFRALLLVSSGWLFLLACGSRSGLPPGRARGGGGPAGLGGAPAEPMCVSAADCPQPPPGQCGSAACTNGVCSLDMGQVCDDGDPCTVDSCVTGSCLFVNGRVDADGDGVFATG